MKQKLFLHLNVRKKLFVHILASTEKTKVSKNLQIWAYYRLGMYSSVLSIDSKKLNWRAYLAKITSYAALGQYKEAQLLLEKFYKCRRCNTHLALLANALASYMSDIALDLKTKVAIPKVLEVALLTKVNDLEMAFKKAKVLIDDKTYRKKPEVLLYYSNLSTHLATSEKLTILNKFLIQFKLTKLRLINKKNYISVNNLRSSTKSVEKKELVSIIMTSYNSSGYIKTAITSVLAQSYTNIELIVVDDCSSDNSVKVIESFVKIDSRVRLIKLDKNVGTYIAKNIALKIAKGVFVTCHDSDDYSHPLKIEKQVLPFTEDLKLVASISNWIRVDEKGNFYTRYIYPLTRLNLSSLMYRKSQVIDKVGFYDSVRTGADSEFYARISLVFGKKRIKRVKLPLSFGSHRENSLMTAKETGYNENAISVERLDYWESWNKWHIEKIADNKTPFIGFDFKKYTSVIIND